MDDDRASLVSVSTASSYASFHPRFLEGNIIVKSSDEVKFRFDHDVLSKWPFPCAQLTAVRYSPMLAEMAQDLRPSLESTALPEQVVPLANARGSTVAFLLDCILTAERRQASGTYPVTVADGNASDGSPGNSSSSGTGETMKRDDDSSAKGAKLDRPPSASVPCQLSEPGSGWPSGRNERNRAKAAEFERNPQLPCPADAMYDRPLDEDAEAGWPRNFEPEAGSNRKNMKDDGSSAADNESTYLTAHSRACSSDNEGPVALALHAPAVTFHEVLGAMQMFELGALRYAVFDALKAAHSKYKFGARLPAEFVYAFSCLYSVGNASYWATRCLASAWHQAGGKIAGWKQVEAPLVHTAFLSKDALSLLKESDRAALERMFGRFSRAVRIFCDSLLSQRSKDDLRFGKKCKTCAERQQWGGNFTLFKRRVLYCFLIPLIIEEPQLVRSKGFLDSKLRQHIACSRCADRFICLVLECWKKIKREVWSLNFNRPTKRKHFAATPARAQNEGASTSASIPASVLPVPPIATTLWGQIDQPAAAVSAPGLGMWAGASPAAASVAAAAAVPVAPLAPPPGTPTVPHAWGTPGADSASVAATSAGAATASDDGWGFPEPIPIPSALNTPGASTASDGGEASALMVSLDGWGLPSAVTAVHGWG